MSKKKVIAGLIALVSVSSSIIPVSYASNENIALNTEVHASQTQNNPYIQQYNKENGITSKSLNSSLSEDDETVYKTLTIYYQEDVKVGKILAQVAKDTDVQIKATSLKKEDKIDVMHKIKEVYSSVKESSDQKVLVDFIERYAKDSKDIASIQFLDAVRPQPTKTLIPQPEEDKKKGVSTSTAQNPAATLNSSFNAATAAEWAYNNYNRYSTDFPAFTKWGSDCTNFVSQALLKGGLAMTGNWYIYKKNNTYLVPESAEQLNYSWSLSDPSPWTSVKEFYSFWRGKYVYGTSRENYEEKHKEIFDRSIYRGDLVIFSKGLSGWITVATHVMIITEYDSTNKDFKLAGHSNERQAYPLLDAIKAYSNIDFYSFR